MTITAYYEKDRCYACCEGDLCFESFEPTRLEDFSKWLTRMQLEGCDVLVNGRKLSPIDQRRNWG